jgi:hypothetical protein
MIAGSYPRTRPCTSTPMQTAAAMLANSAGVCQWYDCSSG